jgi:hypothetical protein
VKKRIGAYALNLVSERAICVVVTLAFARRSRRAEVELGLLALVAVYEASRLLAKRV